MSSHSYFRYPLSLNMNPLDTPRTTNGGSLKILGCRKSSCPDIRELFPCCPFSVSCCPLTHTSFFSESQKSVTILSPLSGSELSTPKSTPFSFSYCSSNISFDLNVLGATQIKPLLPPLINGVHLASHGMKLSLKL